MLVPQMAISAHRQCAAVLVSQPTRHCWNVHARLDAARGKQVAQIMMGNPRHPDDSGRSVHCLLAFTNTHDRCVIRFIRSIFAKSFQEFTHVWDHGNFPHLASHTPLEPGSRVAAYHNLLPFEIHIAPPDVAGFMDSETAVSQKANQVGALPRKARMRSFRFLDKRIKLIVLRQAQFLGALARTLDEATGMSYRAPASTPISKTRRKREIV